ncbi:MAG: aspartyl protease family protein [Bacteroidota bacterium]|jgi:clan AA aspartic protease
MGLTYVTVLVKPFGKNGKGFRTEFLVDSGATDTLAPANKLRKAGFKAIGKMAYELADGSVKEYQYGLGQIEFMGETTAGRIVFGPDDCAPLLGVTALESVGILVDPTNRTLKRLPAIPLK